MKKILSIAGIVCFSMLVAVSTHGIYSWFTDQSQRVNSFSVGMNEVEIREEFPDQELTPGKIIKKEAVNIFHRICLQLLFQQIGNE